MSSDIVELLRLLAKMYPQWGEVKNRSNEAADEIVRLRAARDHAQVQANHLADRLIKEVRRG